MALLLRIVLLTLAAAAAAVFVPRTSGEEYRLTLEWESIVDLGAVSDHPHATPSTSIPLVAVGSRAVALLAPETGDILSSSLRHDSFSLSERFFVNQPQTTGGRLVLTDRLNGERHFVDAFGIPRLYGPILAQFGPDAIRLNHPDYFRPFTLHGHELLTAFDLVPERRSDGTRAILLRADLYGDVRVERIDFSRSRVEEMGVLRTGTIVYGFALFQEDDSVLVLLRGTDPQIVELYSLGETVTTDPVLRYVVPPENTLRSPPLIRRVDGTTIAVRLKDSMLLVNHRAASVRPIPRAGLHPPAGFLPARTLGLTYIEARAAETCMVLMESVLENARRAEWCFPGVTIAALETGMLVLEHQDRFFGIRIAR